MAILNKNLIAGLILILVSVSCSKLSINEVGQMGYLYAPSFDVSLSIDEFGTTKASPELPVLVTPAISEIHFKVTDISGVKWDQTGLWDSPLQLMVGPYSIEASHGSNCYGSAFFYGIYNGNMTSGGDQPQLKLSLKNALAAISISDEFSQHFSPAESNPVTIKSVSGELSCGMGTYMFVPSGEELELTVSGMSSTGENKTFTSKVPAVSERTAVNIALRMTSVDVPSISLPEIPVENAWGNMAFISPASSSNVSADNVAKIKYFASSDDWATKIESVLEGDQIMFKGLTPGESYKVRAEIGALLSNEVNMTLSTGGLAGGFPVHTKDEALNLLDGTDFNVQFVIPKKFKDKISSLTISYCNADGTALRSCAPFVPSAETSNTINWYSDGSTDAEWPFLPKGEYKICGNVTMDGETFGLSEISAASGDPEFNVTAYGTTSYDKYLNGDIVGANNIHGETITDLNYSVGITDALKNNKNYQLSCIYKVDNQEKQVNNNSISDCTWGLHTLTAEVTFSGTTVSSSGKEFHITGLPYRANPPTNKGDHPWTEDQTNWGVEYFNWNETEVEFYVDNLTGSTVIIGSPELHIVSDIKIQANVSSKGKEINIICGDKKQTHKLTDAYTTYSDNFVLNANNKKIQIENTKLSGNKAYVNMVEILYSSN